MQKADSHPHESIQNNDLQEESHNNSDPLLEESQGSSVSQKLSSSDQADAEGIPSCWTKGKYDWFTQKYPWKYCQNGAVGCKTCKIVSRLGIWGARYLHISRNWIEGTARTMGNKDASQKALRKKVIKHCNSKSHKKASEIVLAKTEQKIEATTLKPATKARATTEKCIRTAYFIAFQDYPEIILRLFSCKK